MQTNAQLAVLLTDLQNTIGFFANTQAKQHLKRPL